jgi:hypothetical protein
VHWNGCCCLTTTHIRRVKVFFCIVAQFVYSRRVLNVTSRLVSVQVARVWSNSEWTMPATTLADFQWNRWTPGRVDSFLFLRWLSSKSQLALHYAARICQSGFPVPQSPTNSLYHPARLMFAILIVGGVWEITVITYIVKDVSFYFYIVKLHRLLFALAQRIVIV